MDSLTEFYILLLAAGLAYVWATSAADADPLFHWNTKDRRLDREAAYALSFVRWLPWFAWRPVQLQDDSWAWLGWVERIRGRRTKTVSDWWSYEVEVDVWEYRLKP